MKAAVVYGINDLRLEEIEKPQIERDDQILLTYSPCLNAGDSWIQTILAY